MFRQQVAAAPAIIVGVCFSEPQPAALHADVLFKVIQEAAAQLIAQALLGKVTTAYLLTGLTSDSLTSNISDQKSPASGLLSGVSVPSPCSKIQQTMSAYSH
jgi:pseudouridine-5'-phosphate glycosidase